MPSARHKFRLSAAYEPEIESVVAVDRTGRFERHLQMSFGQLPMIDLLVSQCQHLSDEVGQAHYSVGADRDAHVLQSEIVQSRSEEHTSELQSLMRISYAVFCLNTKTTHTNNTQ